MILIKESAKYFFLLIGLLLSLNSAHAWQFSKTDRYEHDTDWPKDLVQFYWGVDETKELSTAESASGVGVDNRNGLIYTLVRSKPHVRVFNKQGIFINSWSPERVGRVHMLHVDHAGRVWIADNFGHTVTQYSPEGKVLLSLGTFGVSGMDAKHFAEPTDVATTEDGEFIFISDGYKNKRITKFDKTGKYLGMWGGKEAGTSAGEFMLPHSLTVMGNKVYVADREGARVQVFDLEGNFIEDWRDTITPWALANVNNYVLVAGELLGDKSNTETVVNNSIKNGYINPPVRQDVVIFNEAGTIINQISLPLGNQFGQVNWLHGIDVDDTGNLYLADVVGNHVQKWRRLVTVPDR